MQIKSHPSPNGIRPDLLVSLLLVVSTLVVYWQVQGNEFVSYDDPTYLTDNPWIQGGLTWTSVRWAFTTGYANFWHPLTWLSILLDVQLFGMDPGLHHFSSVLYHIATALLLFHALRRMTGSLWRSAMVAGMFALHPLHVESVAWASERKDVLSALFWMATILAYSTYAKRPNWQRYTLTGVAFVLGMMAKPMLVTLPFVLLLLDYWPLGRMRFAWLDWRHPDIPEASTRRLVVEKIPFLVLSLIFSVVAFFTQKEAAVIPFDKLPLLTRVLNGFLSYIDYIQKTVAPMHLAVRYTYDLPIPVAQALGCAFLLLLISAGAIVCIRSRPYWFVGWFWYLGVLVPVIGLVQLGGFAKADRFTYIPTVGLCIALVWGVGDLLRHSRRAVVVSIGIIILLVYSVLTVIQVGYWHDNITLYEHAVKVTREAPVAHNNLGVAFLEKGRLAEAEAHFAEALKLRPFYADAHNNLANVMKRRKEFNGAALHYRLAIALEPDFFEARFNLANLLSDQKDFPEAGRQYLEAMKLRPAMPVVCFNYGKMLQASGRLNDAASCFWEALALDPNDHDAGDHYVQLQLFRGKMPEAEAHYLAALKQQPEVAVWHLNYAGLLQAAGRQEEALAQTWEYFRMNPENPYAEFNLGKALILAGQLNEAIGHFQNVLKIAPQSVEARLQLASALAETGRFPEAVQAGEQALKLARDSNQNEQAVQIEKHLESFRAGKPWRDRP